MTSGTKLWDTSEIIKVPVVTFKGSFIFIFALLVTLIIVCFFFPHTHNFINLDTYYVKF